MGYGETKNRPSKRGAAGWLCGIYTYCYDNEPIPKNMTCVNGKVMLNAR
jgi:hypothetical protein